MVAETAAPRVGIRARPFPLALSAGMVLGALVGVSALVRFLLAIAHPTPIFFADEYIYSTLAHELATTGHPTIRGEPASFPALLEPILTAPFWLFGDAGVALRLTQALNALVMSLAAVPVFLLARKLGLGARWAVGAGALALLVPDMFYVAFVLGEPIAYPLVLAAACAAVYALDGPTRRNQVAFVAFAGLATFARIQFVVLPIAFLGGALLARTGLRRLKLTLGVFALGAIPVAVKGLGYYSVVTDVGVDAGEMVRWFGVDAMLLAYAAGWLVVPGAILALLTPRGRTERAFAGFTVCLAAALFVEAAIYATNADAPGGRFQERYLFTLLPLFTIAFMLSLARGGRLRWFVGVSSALLVVVSARYPLSGWTDRHGRQDSPFLMGVYRLEESIGYDNGSLLVAAAVALLALGATVVAWRRSVAPVALALMAAFLTAVGLGAWSLDARYSQKARETYFPADARWVDHADVGDVTIVNTAGAWRALTLEQLFWNRSITQLVRLRGGGQPDVFGAPKALIGGDGRLFVEGRPLARSIVMTEFAVRAELAGATRVEKTPLFSLWKPNAGGAPRLRMLTGGHYHDGWLANEGYVQTWNAPGTLVVGLSSPRGVPETTLVFRARGRAQTVTLGPGERRELTFVVADGIWAVRWTGVGNYRPAGRRVSVRAAAVRLVAPG